MPDVGKWYKFEWNGSEWMGQMIEITDSTFSVHTQHPSEKMLSLPRPTKLTAMTQKEINLVNEEDIEVVDDSSESKDEPLAKPPASPETPEPTSGIPAEAMNFPQSTLEDAPKGPNPDTVAKIVLVGLFVAICFSFR